MVWERACRFWLCMLLAGVLQSCCPCSLHVLERAHQPWGYGICQVFSCPCKGSCVAGFCLPRGPWSRGSALRKAGAGPQRRGGRGWERGMPMCLVRKYGYGKRPCQGPLREIFSASAQDAQAFALRYAGLASVQASFLQAQGKGMPGWSTSVSIFFDMSNYDNCVTDKETLRKACSPWQGFLLRPSGQLGGHACVPNPGQAFSGTVLVWFRKNFTKYFVIDIGILFVNCVKM